MRPSTLRTSCRSKRSSIHYDETVVILTERLRVHHEDKEFVNRLTVSGLSSPLKAKKRAELVESLAAEIRADTELRVGRAKEQEVESKNGDAEPASRTLEPALHCHTHRPRPTQRSHNR